jgi:hypothetical protein
MSSAHYSSFFFFAVLVNRVGIFKRMNMKLQTKVVHLLYRLQVVFDDVYIGIALLKPQKWSTRSFLIVIPIVQKPLLFFHMFTFDSS